MKHLAAILISLVIIAVASYAIWEVSSERSDHASPSQPTVSDETSPDNSGDDTEAQIGGSFVLEDASGNRITEEDLRGRYSLIYFGYSHCPDICPTSLLTMTQAIESLGPLGSKVRPIFITVDPARDTKERLQEYATNFHPRLLALRGTPDQIKRAAKAYKIYYHLHNEEDKENYLVDHSGIIYFMSPDGEYLTHFSHDDSAEAIMNAMSTYLRSQ